MKNMSTRQVMRTTDPAWESATMKGQLSSISDKLGSLTDPMSLFGTQLMEEQACEGISVGWLAPGDSEASR